MVIDLAPHAIDIYFALLGHLSNAGGYNPARIIFEREREKEDLARPHAFDICFATLNKYQTRGVYIEQFS
ncbi:MAG: hypothetical protein KDD53_05845 [Bdellovibrionales bacterium]|nr:hypothetical protein [Bdellovibrionales bacterium]